MPKPLTTEQRVKNCICEVLGVSRADVTPEATRASLHIDSLDWAELLIALDDEFKTQIPDEVAEKFETVGQITKYCEELPK